jgi:hypothetical protein
VPPADLLAIEYRPSYRLMRTAPLGVPEEPATVQFPSAREPVALILGNNSLPAPPPPQLHSQPTRLIFSPPLSSRAPATAFSPNSKVTKAVEPTRILVGIHSSGEVRFSFLQQPYSGDSQLDAEAVAFLRGLRFAPAQDAPVTWGFATFHWGDDATISK